MTRDEYDNLCHECRHALCSIELYMRRIEEALNRIGEAVKAIRTYDDTTEKTE